MYLPRESSTASCWFLAPPMFRSFRWYRTRGSRAANSRTICSVPSVDALSQTMSSKSVNVWSSIELIAPAR